jgi:uncharacterized membrane protein YsdA (DUF1294 family)
MMNKGSYQPRRKAGLSLGTIFFLLGLCVVPALALRRLAGVFDFRWMLGYVVFISVAAFFLYRHDKKRAESGGWRTPESTLHFTELLGGWPGAFLAQRMFRHKTSKTSYQVMFWLIVAVHEFAAFDFLQDWQYSRKALALLHLLMESANRAYFQSSAARISSFFTRSV